MNQLWIDCAESLPPNGMAVYTKIHDGKGERNHALLKRLNNLWFFADGSMYVYYTPTHWRQQPTSEPQGQQPIQGSLPERQQREGESCR